MPSSVSFGSGQRSSGESADAVVAAVARVRESERDEDGNELSSTAILEVLKQEAGFSKLTLPQVRAAEKKLGSVARLPTSTSLFLEVAPAEEGCGDNHEEIAGFKRFDQPKTDASKCIVRGSGLQEATVRQASYFWVEAYDHKGRKRTSGGDTFFVAIRGPSQSRARVTDNLDGTYLVVWKPHVSGIYSVAVSLFGDLLPGAPFNVQAATTIPCATKCCVRGDALTQAVSRVTQNFDILFKDRLGQVARAVDVDLFVEPVSPDSPRNRTDKLKQGDDAADDGAASVRDGSFREKKGKKDRDKDKDKPEKKDKSDKRDKVHSARGGSKANSGAWPSSSTASSSRTRVDEDVIVATHDELEDCEPDGKSDEITRSRAIRVKVKDKPLIVRASFEKDSEQVGLLMPGQVVTVVEERLPESGEVRACVALDSVARSIDGLAPTGASAAEHASTKFRRVGDASPKLVTADLSPVSSVNGNGDDPAVLAADNSSPILNVLNTVGVASVDGATGAGREHAGAMGIPHQVGWVTLVKSGKKLVSSRVKLGPGSRRQYLGQWARRKLNDRVESISGHLAKTIMSELTSDPSGIGFAFGGVEPGVLHAQGKMHEVHKVSYSIGLAGHYLLHVRLRQQAAAVPGSPFNLQVLPGPAHAKSTHISTAPLRGMVGTTDDTGCAMTVRAADRMGNFCSGGGAKLQAVCDLKEILTSVEDNNDGTYRLKWNSKFSGVFKTRVLIDGLDAIGSPREFTLTSSNPNLGKSDISGDGLKSAVAGKPATFRIAFVDDYGNIAIPGETFKFGMSFQKEREKLSNVKPHTFEGEWEDGDTGVYEMKYVATAAGGCEMHVWCDPNNEGARVAFPGSPFHVAVTAGKASHKVSVVDQWTKVVREEKGDKHSKGTDASALYAGDTITLRPQIFDLYRNLTHLPLGAMNIIHKLPDETESELQYAVQSKNGQETYEIRHETSVAGTHFMHFILFDEHILGSPVKLEVLPDKPDPLACKLLPPGEETLMVDQEYMCSIKTSDRFGNQCISGGLQPQVRLQIIRQGAHDQTQLMPNNHSHSDPAEDKGNGEYIIRFKIQVACFFKMFVNIDKNIPSAGGELPPLTLHVRSPAGEGGENGGAAGRGAGGRRPSCSALDGLAHGLAPGAERSRKKSDKFKSAVSEVMQGFGDADERRDKDALLVAAEAFADGTGFDFDHRKSISAASSGAALSDDAMCPPNNDLFDRTISPSSSIGSRRKSVSAGRRQSLSAHASAMSSTSSQ